MQGISAAVIAAYMWDGPLEQQIAVGVGVYYGLLYLGLPDSFESDVDRNKCWILESQYPPLLADAAKTKSACLSMNEPQNNQGICRGKPLSQCAYVWTEEYASQSF